MRQKPIELQGETDKSTIIIGDFNIPLSVIDKQSKQKISKNIVDLNGTINQLDVYRILNPRTAEYTFFSSSHGPFPKTDHILCRKSHLNKFKRTEIIRSMFSDYSGIKLEINNRKMTAKS